jgi:hypothetical protein
MDIEEQQQSVEAEAEPMVVDPPSLGLEAMQVAEPPAADAASSDSSEDVIKDDLDTDATAEGDAGALSAEQKLIKAVNFKDRCVFTTEQFLIEHIANVQLYNSVLKVVCSTSQSC